MKKKTIIISVSVFLAIIIAAVCGVYFYINNSIYKPTKTEKVFTTKAEEKKAEYIEESGVYNILLCGLDGRKKDNDSRTDSMIVATIDTNSKSIKMISFMRDLFVPIPGHGQSRLNSAYFLGGPELLMRTLNEDFNCNIQYYATIDFHAFQALVEEVGGVDVEVKDYEMKQLNYYIKEANWKHPEYLVHAGFQHLNGQQALSYCRIRKAGNSDYERTERQRKVLSLIIQKVKKMNIFNYPSLFASILPDIKTNIPTAKLANLGYTVLKFGNISVQSIRVPADNMFQAVNINGADVLQADMDKTTAYIDNFLSSTGSSGVSDLPAYMSNNFHADDIAIDKRGTKLKSNKTGLYNDSDKTYTGKNGNNLNNNINQSDLNKSNNSINKKHKKKKKRKKKHNIDYNIENQNNNDSVNDLTKKIPEPTTNTTEGGIN